MCEHEEILEGGEYVCVKCGLVLGKEYVYEIKSYESRDKNISKLYIDICNILDNLNFNIFTYYN